MLLLHSKIRNILQINIIDTEQSGVTTFTNHNVNQSLGAQREDEDADKEHKKQKERQIYFIFKRSIYTPFHLQ